MGKHVFTPEERAKALETRARRKAERAAASAEILKAVDVDKAALGARFLRELERIAFSAKDAAIRISAIRTGLGYCLPSLRAIEHEISGMDPVNINEIERRANEERHGKVDPSEFSADKPGPPGDTPDKPLPEDDRPPLKLREGVLVE